jgi:hypothetical protein
MDDPLGLVPRSGTFAVEHLIDRLRERGDQDSARVLAPQAAWLRSGDAGDLAEVVRRTDAVLDPETQQRRFMRVDHAGAFGENLSFLGEEAWVFDDDLVSLVDGRLQDPERHPTPWDANVAAAQQLREAVEGGRYPTAVRLLVFEGTERLHRALRGLGLDRAVTHLEMRLQRESDESALAERFLGLRGLALDGSQLGQVFRDPLPELRSLVIRGTFESGVLERVRRKAPRLAHLSVRYAKWSEDLLRAALSSADSLKTLQFFDVNQARQFPFAALHALRAEWSHLALLGVPGHLVSEGERARFADDPQIVFVGHDRRETVALDFETHGWPHNAR